MDTITEAAYAKLNLSLDVTGRLPGGYHALTMVMESVELHDEISVTLRGDGEVKLRCDLGWLPSDGRNLAVAAAKAFFSALGEERGADITLCKHIPVGAGMAGGSTDAAAVLRALNRLCSRPFDAEGLRALALTIGSDVPYCVQGGSFLAEGRGERLSPAPMPPECAVVIAKPAFSISTPELFSLVDARRSRTRPDTAGLLRAMEAGDLPGTARRMFNVFEDVLPRRCGEVGALKLRLLDAGAIGSVMTGTGSAVFGLFPDADSAALAAESLRGHCRDCFVTRFVEAIEI